ncbi:MAG: hypothetical protein AAGC92_12880 [Pseudomonadota bacterium]
MFYALGGLEIARNLFAAQGIQDIGPMHRGPNIIHATIPIRSIDEFHGRKMRLLSGLAAEVLTKIGAKTTVPPGPAIFPVLEKGAIGLADCVGPAVIDAFGFGRVTGDISPPPLAA